MTFAAMFARSRRSLVVSHRDFRLLWVGETTSAAGTGIGAVAIPVVAVSTLHAGPAMVGLLEAVVWFPWLVIGLPAGAWVDRLPRRPVMLSCDLVAAVLFLSIPVAAWAGWLGIGQLLAVAVTFGAVNVLSEAARQTYPPVLVGRTDLATANAVLQGSESATGVAGPALSGVITHLFGAATGVLANAVSFAVSAACLTGIRTREAPAQEASTRTSLRSEIAAGLRFLTGDPYLRVLAAGAAAANLTLAGVGALQILFLIDTVGVGPGQVGLLLAGEGVGGVVGATVSATLGRRLGTGRALVVLAVAGPPFGLLVPLTATGPRLAAFVTATFVTTAAIVATNVLSRSFRQAYIPADMLARVSAGMRVVAYCAAPLGALTAGGLAAATTTRIAITGLMGFGVLSGLIYFLGPLRRTRDLPTSLDGRTTWTDPQTQAART